MPNVMDFFRDAFHFGWAPAAGRLIWGCVVAVIGFAIGGYLASKPKSDRPVTWAQAMAGAVGVFAMFLVCYAVIPSEWITFSDKYLQWTADKFVWRSQQSMLGLPWNWPFSMTQQNVRDIIAVGIYVVFFLTNIVLFLKWQSRPTAAELAERGESPTTGRSKFGRPLRRRSAVAKGRA